MEHLVDNPGAALSEVAMILAAGFLRFQAKMSAERNDSNHTSHLLPRKPSHPLDSPGSRSDESNPRVNGATNSHQGG